VYPPSCRFDATRRCKQLEILLAQVGAPVKAVRTPAYEAHFQIASFPFDRIGRPATSSNCPYSNYCTVGAGDGVIVVYEVKS